MAVSLSRLSDAIIEFHEVLLNSHYKEVLKEFNLITYKNNDIIVDLL